MTEYVVLALDGEGKFSRIEQTVQAANDKGAIKAAVKASQIDPEGKFVAVPARSFQVRTLKPRQEIFLDLS